MTDRTRLSSTVAVVMLLLPLLTAISYEVGVDIAPTASAQDPPTCKVGMDVDQWSVEEFDMTGDGYSEGDDMWFSGRTGPTYEVEELCPLRTSFSKSFVLNNDSAVGLRMHLTTGWKYTISANIQPLEQTGEQVLADVYLIKETNWDRYMSDFDSRHYDWDGLRYDIAHSPVWLQNILLWHPYRDVHSYEKLDEVDFAVALDNVERSISIWDTSPSQPDEMFLVVDAWDNIRDYDAKPNGVNMSVDLTIQVEERFSLPNWTVSMVCCGGLLGILAAPFLVHHRYMKAGLDVVESGGGDMMPHLDTAPEKAVPAPTQPEPPQG